MFCTRKYTCLFLYLNEFEKFVSEVENQLVKKKKKNHETLKGIFFVVVVFLFLKTGVNNDWCAKERIPQKKIYTSKECEMKAMKRRKKHS